MHNVKLCHLLVNQISIIVDYYNKINEVCSFQLNHYEKLFYNGYEIRHNNLLQ